MFGEVDLVSGRFQLGRFSVGTCSSKPSFSRDVYGEVGLFSGLLLRGILNVGTYTARSV